MTCEHILCWPSRPARIAFLKRSTSASVASSANDLTLSFFNSPAKSKTVMLSLRPTRNSTIWSISSHCLIAPVETSKSVSTTASRSSRRLFPVTFVLGSTGSTLNPLSARPSHIIARK